MPAATTRTTMGEVGAVCVPSVTEGRFALRKIGIDSRRVTYSTTVVAATVSRRTTSLARSTVDRLAPTLLTVYKLGTSSSGGVNPWVDLSTRFGLTVSSLYT